MEEKNPRAQRGNGRTRTGGPKGGSAPRAEQASEGTRSYKHVKLERQRPQLTKEGGDNRRRSEGAGREERRNFASPKKDGSATLKIIPLGGLDAIGKNMTAFECKDDMILDDAGLMFPDDNHPGVDLILPDYTYVLEHADKLRGIIITHGHEDHTGSLPYLMKARSSRSASSRASSPNTASRTRSSSRSSPATRSSSAASPPSSSP